MEQVASGPSGQVLEPGQSPPIPPPPLPRPVVTIALIAINVVVWGITLALGASAWMPTPQKMIDLGGNLAPLTLGDEPWRLGTAMFLHYGVLHVGMNMLGLWSGGALAERMYGRAAFASLYLLAGLAGGLATVAFKTDAVSAGASGAIFGVFGAVGAFLLVHRDRFEPEALRQQTRGLVVFMGYNLLYGVGQKSIDMSAHLGGLAAGFVVGLALTYRVRPGRMLARVAQVTVLGLVAVAAGAKGLPEPGPNQYQTTLRDVAPIIDRAERMEQELADVVIGAPDNAAKADRLEREVLPSLAEAEERLRRLPTPAAPALARFNAAVLAYTTARRASLVALDDVLRGRTTDGAAVEAARAEAERRLQELSDAAAALR